MAGQLEQALLRVLRQWPALTAPWLILLSLDIAAWLGPLSYQGTPDQRIAALFLVACLRGAQLVLTVLAATALERFLGHLPRLCDLLQATTLALILAVVAASYGKVWFVAWPLSPTDLWFIADNWHQLWFEVGPSERMLAAGIVLGTALLVPAIAWSLGRSRRTSPV